MITATFLALGLFLGYTVTVGFSMAATFAITSVSHDFVATKEFRMRRRFKVAQDVIWLVGATAGGYVASWVVGSSHPVIGAVALVAILVGVLWMNAWEMRQRGVPHQIVMSLMSAAGVAAGFVLHLR
jgi:uncharacterized oligopeptide transporter (OPT) family protein